MRRYNLGFISDDDIYDHVKNTVEKYRFQIDLKTFSKNILDPIKLTFDSKVYDKTLEEIVENEILRQMDKSNTNHIGYFHQNIFKYISNDWIVPDRGFDLINENKKIFVEMKNKHNTMNSSSSQKTYIKMQGMLLGNANNRCFLVEIISKKSQNTPWIVSIDGTPYEHEFIRKISIDKFYELVTNDCNAFKKLCENLPNIIDDVIGDLDQQSIENSVLEELKNISPNILKSIYLLSFGRYEGFSDFDILQ
jgi:hypothetical protein